MPGPAHATRTTRSASSCRSRTTSSSRSARSSSCCSRATRATPATRCAADRSRALCASQRALRRHRPHRLRPARRCCSRISPPPPCADGAARATRLRSWSRAFRVAAYCVSSSLQARMAATSTPISRSGRPGAERRRHRSASASATTRTTLAIIARAPATGVGTGGFAQAYAEQGRGSRQPRHRESAQRLPA